MKKRNFLKMVMLAVASYLPIKALDFRKLKPKAWFEKNPYPDRDGNNQSFEGVYAALKDLYGDVNFIESKDVILITPQISETPNIPIKIKTNLNAKTVALLQNVNPTSLIAVFNINENMIVDYFLRIKMRVTGYVVAVVETTDKKYYIAKQKVHITCGGEGCFLYPV